MLDLFDMAAKITLDSSSYTKGMDEAENKGTSFASKISTAAKVGVGAMAAIGGAAAGVATGFVAAAKSAGEYGDNVGESAAKMGMSTDAYQKWSYVLKLNGADISSMTVGMKTLSKQAQANNEDFQKLGISQNELKTLSQEDLFKRTVEGLSNMQAGTERTTLASELLGKSGIQLGAVFDQGADGINASLDAADKLGIVMGGSALDAAGKFNDTLDSLKMTFSAFKNKAVTDFLPSLTSIMDGLQKLMSGQDGAVEEINQGINDFIAKIAESAPKILEAGGKIIESLASGIAQNLPSLIQTAVTVIQSLVEDLTNNADKVIDVAMQIINALLKGIITLLPIIVQAGVQLLVSLINGITDALPQLIAMLPTLISLIVNTLLYHLGEIIEAGLELLIALVQGLVQALPQLIDMLPTIINTIVDTLTANLPYIVEAGIQILIMLTVGIIRAIPQLISKLPEIFDNMNQAFNDMDWGTVGAEIMDAIGNAISSLAGDAWSWGSDMIDNFIGGITQKWNDLKDTVSNVAQTVANFLGFSEPKEGPLSRFHTYAPDMMELFAKGISDNENIVTGQISKSFNFGDTITAPTSSPLALATAGGAGININVYLPEGGDTKAFAREVKNELITALGIDGATYGN